MKTIYMVVGCPCSGKSWVCSKLLNEYCYVPHDDHVGNANHYLTAIVNAAKTTKPPLLIETPFSMSQLLEPLEKHGFKVTCVFILEDPPELERRYRARENKPIPIGHLSRQKTYAQRAYDMQAFSGTSTEVLAHLKRLANDLRMRESGNGRDKMPPGGYPYRVGETVVAVADGERGTVVSVDAKHVEIQFSCEPNYTIGFPLDTSNIRKLWPWET